MTKRSSALVSIVVPAFNEAGGLAEFAREMQSTMISANVLYEVVFVDDGSSDATWQCIRDIAAQRAEFRGIRLSRNFGKEAALSAGLDASHGGAVIIMDGDLQHPPSLVPKMIEAWKNDEADIVDAIKENRGKESALSKLRAIAFYRTLKFLSGHSLEGLSDFKLLDRVVVDKLRTLEERNRFFRGMVAWLGYRHVQIPFSVQDRNSGQSSWSLWKLCWLAIGAITSFSTLPLHFSTLAGVVFAIAAFLLGVQTLYVWTAGQAVAGFTTVILLLLIIGSIVLLSVGVIGEYVAKIYHEVKCRPVYIVSDSVETNHDNK